MPEEPPDLIRKLAALANHPGTPPHEAAAARAKLQTLLARNGMTEADIDDERAIPWELKYIDSHEKELLAWVVSMLLDRLSIPLQWKRSVIKDWTAELSTTRADRIDVLACYSYYRKLLDKDRTSIRREAADIRRRAREMQAQAKVLSASVKQLPEAMRSKYMIFPPFIIRKAREQSGVDEPCSANDSAPRKLTPAERRKEQQSAAEWAAARARMTKADAWQKGEGLATGTFALEG